ERLEAVRPGRPTASIHFRLQSGSTPTPTNRVHGRPPAPKRQTKPRAQKQPRQVPRHPENWRSCSSFTRSEFHPAAISTANPPHQPSAPRPVESQVAEEPAQETAARRGLRA